MNAEIWKAARLLLAQLLNLDINEQLAREIDYLKAENQVLKSQLKQSGKRLKFTNEQRRTLAVKAKALGKRLSEVVTIVRPETILRWHRRLVALKYDSSKVKRKSGRPKVDVEIEQLMLKFVMENNTWDMAGLLARLETWAIKFPPQPSLILCAGMALILPVKESEEACPGRRSSKFIKT